MDDKIEYRSFLALLLLVSIVFIMLMLPFFTAIFWAIALSIVFMPLHVKILQKVNNKNIAALLTIVIASVMVVFPLVWVLQLILQEGLSFYNYLQSGQINFADYFDSIRTNFPYITEIIEKIGVDPTELKEQIKSFVIKTSTLFAQYSAQIGQNLLDALATLGLLLYISFFILTDNKKLIQYLHLALPLGDTREALFFEKFATVTRATIKGSLAVAVAQGALGGMIFAFLDIKGAVLWGSVMIVFSLIPLVGSALIWLPVAVYLIGTGDMTSGIILILFGVIVIGLVDNVLRPILVGKDTKLPDYLVLLSTLGGFTLFGMNGFVMGPLIATLFVTTWDIFIQEFNNEKDAVIKSLNRSE